MLVPVGGLANRMKAIDSAIKLSRKTNSELHIIWFKDRGLNCRFDQLFEPIDLPNVKITEATWSDYLLYDRPRQKNIFIPHLFQKATFDNCIYEKQALHLFYENFDFYDWAAGEIRLVTHWASPADEVAALARAIALDPELIMYDEPFAGLDPISLGTSAQLIRQLNDAMGLTTIIVSHDLDETFRIADQVIILGNGRVAAQGAPEDVRHSPDPLVQQFINAQPEGPVHFHYPGADLRTDFGLGAFRNQP